MNLIELKRIAKSFRAAIESIPANNRPDGLNTFPTGSCGDATLLLGAYLSDIKVSGFEYILGERGFQTENSYMSHAWLQNGQLIIDITADQFPEVIESVIVCENSSWHRTFDAESLGCSDFRKLNGNLEHLVSVYEEINVFMSNNKG